MSADLDWQGEALLARYLDAARGAIDETTAAAAAVARGIVRVDTGTLRSRIVAIPATVQGDTARGAFGVPDDPGYALPQEFLPEPRGRAYLRPSADREFPQLGRRTATRLQR